MDAAILKVFVEEVIKLPLLSGREGEHSGVEEFSSRCEVDHMVPCFPWGELIKGFPGEDVSEVLILGQYHVLKRSAFSDFLGLLS